ncbi:ABC-three component system protein [Bacillus sp. B1-b2]|uniref:ABC-three component system protein n=1 Tax=Bacillus sp. B1-b2 TaxID=2653201 RepID=UPI0012623563|nr:ABC-three component system protein [Bacillus sp. B1-b2]KAB7665556.1 trypsin-like peptidase domain-containing protein [Bacillus sp. B1-b2]
MRPEFKQAVAQLECGSDSIGTAFLVAEQRAITARHTIDDYWESGEKISLIFFFQGNRKTVEAKVIYPEKPYVGLDIAILEILEPVAEINPLIISTSEVIPETNWSAYGYSTTKRDTGELFSGIVKQTNIPNVEDGKYDLDLSCVHPQIIDINYKTKGASGSPILINDKVVGVISDKIYGGSMGGVSLYSCLEILKKELGSIVEENDTNNRMILDQTGKGYPVYGPVSSSGFAQTATLTTLEIKLRQARETIIQLVKDFPKDSHSVLYQRLDEVVMGLTNLGPSDLDNYLKQYRFPFQIDSGDYAGLEQLIEILTLIKCKFPDMEFVYNDQTANLSVDIDQDYYNFLVYAVRRHTKMPEILLEIVRTRLKTPTGKKAVQRGEVILPYPIIMDNCSGHKKVNLCKNCQSEFSFENIIKSYCASDDEGYFSGIEKNNLGLLQEIKVLCASCLRDLHNEVDNLDGLLQRIEEMIV